MIAAERRDHLTTFEKRHADERRDLLRLHRRALVVAEPRVCRDVADRDRLAAPERFAQLRADLDEPRLSNQRRHAARVLAADDVVAALDFRITDPPDAEMLAEQPCRGFLDVAGVAQRAERVVQSQEKRQTLFVRAQLRFGFAVLKCRPRAIGDLLGQHHFVRRPPARHAAVNAERRDEPAVLDQKRADVRADPRRLQRRALLRRVRFCRGVVDEQRAALQDFFGAAAAQIRPRKAAGLRRKAVDVLADDDAVGAVDLAVTDAIDVQVRAQQAAGLREDTVGIGERSDGVVQRAQERLPLLHAAEQLLGPREPLVERGQRLALGRHAG